MRGVLRVFRERSVGCRDARDWRPVAFAHPLYARCILNGQSSPPLNQRRRCTHRQADTEPTIHRRRSCVRWIGRRRWRSCFVSDGDFTSKERPAGVVLYRLSLAAMTRSGIPLEIGADGVHRTQHVRGVTRKRYLLNDLRSIPFLMRRTREAPSINSPVVSA